MVEQGNRTPLARRLWWHARFIGCACMLLPFTHRRVQRLVNEKLRMDGFDV